MGTYMLDYYIISIPKNLCFENCRSTLQILILSTNSKQNDIIFAGEIYTKP